jgi:hypothetical protein
MVKEPVLRIFAGRKNREINFPEYFKCLGFYLKQISRDVDLITLLNN